MHVAIGAVVVKKDSTPSNRNPVPFENPFAPALPALDRDAELLGRGYRTDHGAVGRQRRRRPILEYDLFSEDRAPEGLGKADTALLQRAAMALLAGEGEAPTDAILGALGITDFGVRQTTEGNVQDTVVSIGRQLGRHWYVGYERGVNATTGTWQLIYRLAQRFTLRAQSGTDNALDLIWSWRLK